MKIKRHWEWIFMLLFMWIFFVLWSWIFAFRSAKLFIAGTKTIWVVTDVYAKHDSDGVTYSVTAQYDCWSETWIKWYSMWSSSAYRYRVWEKIELYCDENDPNIFLPKNFVDYLIFLFPLAWFFILWYWIKRMVDNIKRKKLKKELTQFGVKVEAIVTDISSSWIVVNNHQWYRINAQYLEDFFVSEDIFADIWRILKQGDKIDVYFDPWDHSIYRMDTDSIFKKPFESPMVTE